MQQPVGQVEWDGLNINVWFRSDLCLITDTCEYGSHALSTRLTEIQRSTGEKINRTWKWLIVII